MYVIQKSIWNIIEILPPEIVQVENELNIFTVTLDATFVLHMYYHDIFDDVQEG